MEGEFETRLLEMPQRFNERKSHPEMQQELAHGYTRHAFVRRVHVSAEEVGCRMEAGCSQHPSCALSDSLGAVSRILGCDFAPPCHCNSSCIFRAC